MYSQWCPYQKTPTKYRTKICVLICFLSLSVWSCSILNKLTPDNFERLINELMHHAGVSSRDTLKGTILLVSHMRIM